MEQNPKTWVHFWSKIPKHGYIFYSKHGLGSRGPDGTLPSKPKSSPPPGQKLAKLENRVCFWSYRQILKGHDGQIKKNACKNAYLGSIFIPEKYVIRVLFVCPWTSLIPPLAIRVAPGMSLDNIGIRPWTKAVEDRHGRLRNIVNI